MQQNDSNTGNPRKRSPLEQRRARRWRYYEIAFVIFWVAANLLLRPGSIGFHLTSPRWIIGTLLGGIVLGVLFGYVVKTLCALQRGAKHRRILRSRAGRASGPPGTIRDHQIN